jgi:hypothetical protein
MPASATTVLVFVFEPDGRPPSLGREVPSDRWVYRKDQPADFLSSQIDAVELKATVRHAVASLRRGHTLHTLLRNGSIAAWGWSFRPSDRATLPGSQLSFAVPPGSVVLHDFHVTQISGGAAAYEIALAHTLRTSLAEGAKHAYVCCTNIDSSFRAAIEKLGCRLAGKHRFVRFLWWSWRYQVPDPRATRDGSPPAR